MKAILLYTLILVGVLTEVRCAGREPSTDSSAPAPTVAPTIVPGEAPSNIENRAAEVESETTDPMKSNEPEGNYRIVFLGDSITAGFGVDEQQAFPSWIQRLIIEHDLPFTVVNAGISGDTSTGGLNRIEWLLRNQIDILVLELGGNDGLRGIDLALTRSNLSSIIARTLERYPDARIIVAGMMIPPNLGHEYTTEFRAIFPSLSEQFGATLIPFILEGVGGVRELNQPDGIHPTPEGHEIVARNVWTYLEPLLVQIGDDQGRPR